MVHISPFRRLIAHRPNFMRHASRSIYTVASTKSRSNCLIGASVFGTQKLRGHFIEDATKELQQKLLFHSSSAEVDNETHEFKAETKKLLEIVAHSLYSDKEIFIRELISNASDALEKLRFLQSTAQVSGYQEGEDTPLKIILSVDSNMKTFTIEDTGIGMTRNELIDNLGTIARSGSLSFLEDPKLNAKDKANAIIGKFGVGFYSSFVVADEVEVFSRSGTEEDTEMGWHWQSNGLGSFTVGERSNLPRGTKIVLSLKDDCLEFCNQTNVEKLAERFSSFVSFPLYIKDGETEKRLNTQEALWLKDSITDEEHKQFFKYLSGTSYGDAMYTFTFRSDIPLSIKSIFYIPEDPPNRMFQSKTEVGVSLYSRRVMVKKSAEEIVPKWLFFVKGVVDCEDMPLNISRENMQDMRLIERLSTTVVKRILRFFEDEAKVDPEKYMKFYKGYSYNLKEGLLEDTQQNSKFKENLLKLLRFECTNKESQQFISLDEYIDMMKPGQQNMYYFCATNRKTALASPYMEQFKQKKRNVLLLYEDIDEFVAMNLQNYKDKKFVAIDSSEEDFEPLLEEGEATGEVDINSNALQDSQKTELEAYMKSILGEKVNAIKFSNRLVDSPAVVTGFLSGSLRKMMKASMRGSPDAQMGFNNLPVTLELNPNHSAVIALYTLRLDNTEVARIVAEQLYDNACVAAGIIEDPRTMLSRLNEMLNMTIDLALKNSDAVYLDEPKKESLSAKEPDAHPEEKRAVDGIPVHAEGKPN